MNTNRIAKLSLG